MKAVTWQGTRSVGVTDVPDPEIREPTDAIVRVSSTAICGSDLHLYELLGPFLDRGDILGHEAMSQCETTQVREHGSGAALFGYTKLYGQIPGCQAEYVRVPLADHTSIPVENDLPDERYLFLSDVLPTAWQAVGMEAHGSPGAAIAQKAIGVLPDPLAAGIMERAGVDRLAALRAGIAAVRRGGVLSIAGVYAGQADPLPMLTLFDKQITLRMGQCNVLRWTDDIIGLVRDPRDPLGVTDLATHRVGLSEAARMYDLFQQKQDGCVKVVMRPEVG